MSRISQIHVDKRLLTVVSVQIYVLMHPVLSSAPAIVHACSKCPVCNLIYFVQGSTKKPALLPR